MRSFVRLSAMLVMSASMLGFASAADPIPGVFRSWIVLDNRFAATEEGNRVGKLHCLVCEQGIYPTLAVIARTPPENKDSALFGLFALQDGLSEKYRSLKFGAFTIFVSMEKEFHNDDYREKSIARIESSLREAPPKRVSVGLAELKKNIDGREVDNPALTELKIAEADDITVLLYNRMTIVKRWSFTKEKSPTEADLAAIRTATDDLMIDITGRKKK